MISVIIPFYNVEKYIERCILSVKNQTFTDFECILIDDESPDHSYEIAKKNIEGDSRFRIIQQKNKGLGGARNTGIQHAKGDFLAFLDSDDYWEPTFLEKMYHQIIQSNADIVEYKYAVVNETTEKLYNSGTLKKDLTSARKIQRYLVNSPTTWNKIYKKELFHSVLFPEKRYYEDLATTYKLASFVKKISSVPEVLINYSVRSNSVMRTFTQKHYNDMKITLAEINQRLGKNFIPKEDVSLHLIRISFEDEAHHEENKKNDEQRPYFVPRIII